MADRRVIGHLSVRSRRDSETNLEAFLAGLADGGVHEGNAVAIEYRWADGH